jgi:DnaJ-class molecular chaperone
MQEKCGNCQGTGNVTFNLGVTGHTVVRCAFCHGTGHFNLTHKSQANSANNIHSLAIEKNLSKQRTYT